MRQLNKAVWKYITVAHNINGLGMDDWCAVHIGNKCRDWYGYNTSNSERIYGFKTSEQILMFKLRWE
jgi:hypothetical protein